MLYGLREVLVMAVLGLVAKFVGAGIMLAGVFAYVFGASAYAAIDRAWTRWRSRPAWPQASEDVRLVEVAVEGFSELGASDDLRNKRPRRGRSDTDKQEA